MFSRFELAIQLGELKIAYEIALEDQVQSCELYLVHNKRTILTSEVGSSSLPQLCFPSARESEDLLSISTYKVVKFFSLAFRTKVLQSAGAFLHSLKNPSLLYVYLGGF